MKKLLGHFHDWRHERRIKRLSRKSIGHLNAGNRAMAMMYWRLMVDAINQRSPAQVARMERRMGIR